MLPQINVKTDTLSMQSSFRGINKNLYVNEDEFSDMQNITNDNFPVLTNRIKRGTLKNLTNCQAMLGGRYLSFVDDNKLYYDETYVCDLNSDYKDEERQLVQMGAYLCVFPDGIIYNTYKNETSTITNEVTTTSTVTLSMCKYDGSDYDYDVGTTEPTDKTHYWLDTSGGEAILKMYSSSSSQWVSVASTYVKIAATGIGEGFKDYDAIHFYNVDANTLSEKWIYNDSTAEGYFNQNLIAYKVSTDYIIVAGLISTVHTNSTAITAKREMPKMDFVCEQDNRLWGCSSDEHEIYACKLGDPTNWNFFAGLDSDSYAATVGTQNIFTGICSYSGYVFFFKEDGYHKLYGTKPSNYEMQFKAGRGVQQGSSKSIAIVNDYLIFKTKDGVAIYDGSVSLISGNLGLDSYYDAVAANYRNKYYITMRDSDYEYYLYVYDTSKGAWIKEDKTRFKYACYTNNGMYFTDINDNLRCVSQEMMYEKIFPQDPESGQTYTSETLIYPNDLFYAGNYSAGKLEDTIEWSFTTGDLGQNTPNQKYVKRINVRLLLDTATNIKIEIMYDSSDDWEQVIEYYCTKKRSYEIPIPVQRNDHFKLRFSGKGDFKLYSIAKAVEEGSDV